MEEPSAFIFRVTSEGGGSILFQNVDHHLPDSCKLVVILYPKKPVFSSNWQEFERKFTIFIMLLQKRG
jgi:hypothetical protein